MYLGFLSSKQKGSEYKLDIDRDFIFPFLIALSIAVVVSFQTGGFTQNKPAPVLQWPKVKRSKRVKHKRVVVDDDTDIASEDNKKEN